VLILRGTARLRERRIGRDAEAGEASTTLLGDWFATALFFWRPRMVLLVNTRTLLPVVLPMAPARTLADRVPVAIETVLRLHGVDEETLTAERDAMREVRVAPTDNRSVVGVMNELTRFARWEWDHDRPDAVSLSMRLSGVILGPLSRRAGSPDRELAAVLGIRGPRDVPDNVIPFPGIAGHGEPVTAPPRGPVYRLAVTLQDTDPPIWRRVLVDGARTLDHLHEVLQAAFGWWNCHLYEFETASARYGIPNPDWDIGPPTRDARTTRIDAAVGAGAVFLYRYDFGDGWVHMVRVEEALPAGSVARVPACLDGARACPPEDCGGPWGYGELLEILADPAHPEHAERVAWLDRPFDPEAFDPTGFEDDLRLGRLAAFDDD